VRLASQAIELLPEPEPVPRLLEVTEFSNSLFEVGEAVKAPRYGEGVVASVKGDEISVRFPDKSLRTFLAEFLKKAKASARRSATPRRPPARSNAVA
jgi:ATP-dependent DNA helicase RecQ